MSDQRKQIIRPGGASSKKPSLSSATKPATITGKPAAGKSATAPPIQPLTKSPAPPSAGSKSIAVTKPKATVISSSGVAKVGGSTPSVAPPPKALPAPPPAPSTAKGAGHAQAVAITAKDIGQPRQDAKQAREQAEQAKRSQEESVQRISQLIKDDPKLVSTLLKKWITPDE